MNLGSTQIGLVKCSIWILDSNIEIIYPKTAVCPERWQYAFSRTNIAVIIKASKLPLTSI